MFKRFKLTPANLSIGLSVISLAFIVLGVIGLFIFQNRLVSNKSLDDRSQASEFRGESTPVPQPSPYIENGKVKTCSTDADCPAPTTCYQPPMPVCPPGVFCIQRMPSKQCAYPLNPTPSPVIDPIICRTDADCGTGNECYQPPMPPCPQDMACAQVMPPMRCRPKGSPAPSLPPFCRSNTDCPNGYVCYSPNQDCLRTGTCPQTFAPTTRCVPAGSVPSPTPKPTSTPAPTPLPSPIITSTPTPAATPVAQRRGDFNDDGAVNLIDFSILKQEFLRYDLTNLKADLDGDGKVNLKDYTIFITLIEL